MKLPPPIARSLDRVPLPLARAAARLAFRAVMRRHPDLFERLGDQADKRFAFVPTDIDLLFLIHPKRRTIIVERRRTRRRADAVATGPLPVLLALLEGRVDGDALFFARDIAVSGDMEAMLALRNALDDCSIDLPRDLGAAAGPLGPVVTRLAAAVRDRLLPPRARAWS